MTTTKQFIDGMSENHLKCRRRHEWQPFTAKMFKRQGYAYGLERCPNCDSFRHEIVSTRRPGQVIDSWISYGPGYLNRGNGPLTQADRDRMRWVRMQHAFSFETGELADAQALARKHKKLRANA